MMRLVVVALLVVVPPAVFAAGYPGGGSYSGSGYPGHGSGSGYPGSGGSGYPSGGGYGGYYPAYSGYYAPQKPLTETDQLFARRADLDAEIFILTEEYQTALSRFARIKNEFETLRQIALNLEETATRQASQITTLENEESDFSGIVSAAEALIMTVASRNTNNTNDLLTESARAMMATLTNTVQTGDLAGASSELDALQIRFHQLFTADFLDVDLDIDDFKSNTIIISNQADRRRCETGTVTMHRDDRRAEAIFVTDFGENTPTVIFGISGYDFDLKARKNGSPYGGYGYSNYGYSYEPNAIGVYVQGSATPDSITFSAVNLGFGQTDLISVTISYEACSFGGIPPVP